MTDIWDTPGIGFGDMWAALGFLMHKSAASGSPSIITRWSGPVDMKPRLQEMLALLASHPTARVLVTDDAANTSMHMDCWASRRWPTTIRWTPPINRVRPIIAYQFDGRSSAEKKNPPPSDIALFHAWTASCPVGLPLSLLACVERLSEANAFVGSCSGMAHLAHSVGVPVYLLRYEHDPAWWHGDNPVTICDGMQEFISAYERNKR